MSSGSRDNRTVRTGSGPQGNRTVRKSVEVIPRNIERSQRGEWVGASGPQDDTRLTKRWIWVPKKIKLSQRAR